MKRVLISTGIFIALLVLTGFIMELVKTDQQEYMRYMRTRNVFQYEPGNAVFDPMTGYRIKPGLNEPFDNKEFKTTVHTNTLGFRDDEPSLHEPDALFLGDSYVWGWGVEEQDDVEKQYERLTGKKVLNMGVPGYGNLQELMMLYKWAKVMPPAGKPIFLFFCANDIYDNENTSFDAFPYFKQENGQVALAGPTQDGFNSWQEAVNKWTIHGNAAKKIMLVYYLQSAFSNMAGKDIYKDYQTDTTRVNGGRAFMIVAKELAAFCNKYQNPLTIVYIPPVSSYRNGVPDKTLELVATTCQKMGFRFADLSNVLTQDDYYRLDQHWKPEAHKKVAAALSALK